ncbi:MAG: hypothetical protein VKN72_17600 [Nostocales cyanobacterium 94392]|nr:hypothetical protein [Nostocales cyanobacterium 94392]
MEPKQPQIVGHAERTDHTIYGRECHSKWLVRDATSLIARFKFI